MRISLCFRYCTYVSANNNEKHFFKKGKIIVDIWQCFHYPNLTPGKEKEENGSTC